MDQCVCTEQNDTSRYAGVRESLGSSEHQGALLIFLYSTTPTWLGSGKASWVVDISNTLTNLATTSNLGGFP
jgi:hypothetical protein